MPKNIRAKKAYFFGLFGTPKKPVEISKDIWGDMLIDRQKKSRLFKNFKIEIPFRLPVLKMT